MTRKIEQLKERASDIGSRYGLRKPMEIITQRVQRCDELTNLLNLHTTHRISKVKSDTDSITEKLEMVSPLGILNRGYSYIRDNDGNTVKSFKQVAIDDKISIILNDGGLESRVTRIDPEILKKSRKK